MDIFVKLEAGDNSHVWSVDAPGPFYNRLFERLASFDKFVLVWDDNANTWNVWGPNYKGTLLTNFSVAHNPLFFTNQ